MKKTLALLTLLLTFQIIKAEIWTAVPDTVHPTTVWSFAEDKFGWYWMASWTSAGGAYRWNGVDSLEQYKYPDFPQIPGNLAHLVGSDDGDIFITGGPENGGLLHFDTTGTFHYYDSTNSGLETTFPAWAYFYEPQKGLWLTHGVTWDNRFRFQFFDGTNWSAIDTTLLQNSSPGPRSLQRDYLGRLWFTQYAYFIEIVPVDSFSYNYIPMPNGPFLGAGYSMLVGSQGGIWGAKGNATEPQVYHWDEDTTWTYYSTSDFGLQNSGVIIPVVLGEDNGGNIWFGFVQGYHGLMKFDGNQFNCCYTSVANGQSLMLNVQHSAKDSKGRLWFFNNNSFSNDVVILDTCTAVGIAENSNQEITDDYTLFQNYPNPFNPRTTISFYVPQKSKKAKITIFNILGKEVMQWNFGEVLRGTHKFNWYGEDSFGKKVSSGVYFYRLETDNFERIKKMTFIK